MSKETSTKNLEKSEAYILITFCNDGVSIDCHVGSRAFTMLGGIELAKMNLIEGFKGQAANKLVP